MVAPLAANPYAPAPQGPVMPSGPLMPPVSGGPLQRFGQRLNQGMNRFFSGGPVSPLLTKEEADAAKQRQRMAMIAALLQNSGPAPKGTRGLLQPFGAAIGAGIQSQDQSTAQALQARLAEARMMIGATSQAKPPASIAEYELYAEQERAAGREPMSFQDFVKDISVRRVGAQYGTPTDVPGRGYGVPSRTTGEFDVISPEGDVSASQAQRSAEKESAVVSAREETQAQTQARLALPRIQSQVEASLAQVKALRNHPGRAMATGRSRLLQAQRVPGTAAYDFDVLREQVSGGVFLEAYQALKGGGTITEIEGSKAEAAKARMDAAQSEPAFLDALDDYEAALNEGLRLAIEASGGSAENRDPLGIRR